MTRPAGDTGSMMAASKTTRATSDAESLAAQAEAEAAEAEAQAAAARARAAALRAAPAAPEVEDFPAESDADAEAAEVADTDEAADSDDSTEEPEVPKRRRFLRMPRWSTIGLTAAVLAICALLTVSGLIIWQHHESTQRIARQAEFSAAARQGVVNLMSLNFNQGDQDIQRLIDSTTGSFRADFEKSKNDFLSVMKDSKVVSQAEVKATGIQSMSDDTALVLVSATSQVSNSASAQQSPRAWRLAVTIQRDNGQLKMSKVEFVP